MDVNYQNIDICFVCVGGYDMPYSRVRAYHFAEILQKFGFRTTVLSFQECFTGRKDGNHMLSLPLPLRLLLTFRALNHLKKYQNAIFYIQKVHYHAAAPHILSRYRQNRIILDYDDYDLDRSPLFQLKIFNKLLFGEFTTPKITKKIAREAIGCVAASQPLVKLLAKENRNILYLPTGVNVNRFKVEDENHEKYITFLWTGQIWGKVIYDNILFLLQCFKGVLNANINAKLMIVGRGKWMNNVKKLMKSEVPKKHYEITEWIEPDKMNTVISKADIGLLPLIPDEANKEWMISKSPTKLFEYMACGLPCIATPNGDVTSILRHGKDGYLAQSKESFTNAMIHLVKNKELRLQMGKNARQNVENDYSIDVLGARLANWIKNFIHGQGVKIS